jgi:DNA adenine methylase
MIIEVPRAPSPEPRRCGTLPAVLASGINRKTLPPPLKWAGGKRWQVPHVEAIWRHHSERRLVEPFCGGLAMALGLRAGRALLNDANPHLINFYRWIAGGLRPSIDMRNDEALFYRYRDRFNELVRSGRHEVREAAELFYYMNRTAYNGLCRFNSDGEFNTPFGQYKQINYARSFAAYRDTFAAWEFTTGDFGNLRLEPDDFVYADPPYDVEFTSYSQGGFSWDDQVRAAESFATHPGPVVLVNQCTPRIGVLYRKLGYTVTELIAPRRISCTGDRTPVKEIFATRNLR